MDKLDSLLLLLIMLVEGILFIEVFRDQVKANSSMAKTNKFLTTLNNITNPDLI